MKRIYGALPALALLTACSGDPSTANFNDFVGPTPVLESPVKSNLPVINIADAKGWPEGMKPTPAAGLTVNEFAGGLQHPRWMLVLENGDVLAAETDGPDTDKTGGKIASYVAKKVQQKAGAERGSANRIVLLRDADKDGVAEERSVLIDHDLYSPFGMAMVGDELFVGNANALVAFPFKVGEEKVAAKPRLVAELPSGYNHHWVKNLIPSPDGQRIFVGVGSNSNVGENGLEMEKGRAAVWEIDAKTGQSRIYASGLRNPVGLEWNPWSGALWTVVNERDEIGNNLVPDYMTSVKEGAFYGWPWSYYGQHVDERPQPANPAMVAKAIAPDYALGPHVAALGLAFSSGQKLGPQYAEGAFVGEHGSWNRNPWSGYHVVYVPFAGAQPVAGAKPVEVLSGFRVGDVAYGRPVGVEIHKDGSLLVADDVGGKIWRVSKAG